MDAKLLRAVRESGLGYLGSVAERGTGDERRVRDCRKSATNASSVFPSFSHHCRRVAALRLEVESSNEKGSHLFASYCTRRAVRWRIG